MGDDSEEPDSKIHLVEGAWEKLGAAAHEYALQVGYEPPPNVLDAVRAIALVNPNEGLDVDPVSPFEEARVRETARTLIEELRAVEPRELEFDPFFGEVEGNLGPNVGAIRSVMRGELFVVAVAAEARLVWQQVLAMKPAIEDARHVAAERRAERAQLERLARENFEHATRHRKELEAADDSETSWLNKSLRAKYGFDAATAAQVVDAVQIGDDVDDLNEMVADFTEHWGVVFDAARIEYANATAKRRRSRRVRRTVLRILFGVLIAFVTLLLDAVAGKVAAFAGSAILAALAFGADFWIDRMLDDRVRLAQIDALADAVQDSAKLLSDLLLRESQLNGLRALRGLPAVEVVRRSTLKAPLL